MDIYNYAHYSSEQLEQELNTSIAHGLNTDAINKRHQQYGYNELAQKEDTWKKLLIRQFRSYFTYLLVAASVVSLILSDYTNALIISTIVVINGLLSFYQEYRAAQALTLLKQKVYRTTQVIRSGKKIAINSKELVPGDIIELKAGDSIPADVRFVSEAHHALKSLTINARNSNTKQPHASQTLSVDESVLTGESATTYKVTDSITDTPKNIYEARNIGFLGTMVTNGYAKAVVLATGSHTIFGTISKLTLETIQQSSFQERLTQLSKFILAVILITLTAILLFHIWLKGEQTPFLELLFFAIALTVGLTPEALPTITTFALSRGALQLAKHNVVVKRLSAIEDLGAITLLCTDKTGTLTQNILTVADFFVADRGSNQQELLTIQMNENTPDEPLQSDSHTYFNDSIQAINENSSQLLNRDIQDSQSAIQKSYKTENEISEDVSQHLLRLYSILTAKEEQIDPFDKATFAEASPELLQEAKTYKRIVEIPFDFARKRSTAVVEHNGKYILISRGAYESIRHLCLSPTDEKTINEWIKTQAKKGNRVLTIAYKEIKSFDTSNQGNLNQDNFAQQEQQEHDLTLLGMLSFHDPVKPTAQDAVHKAYRLGIKLKMITGDSKEIGAAVAQSIGMIKKEHDDTVVSQKLDKNSEALDQDSKKLDVFSTSAIDGAEFAALSTDEKRNAVQKYTVFARILPEQKYEIVNLLKENNIVGFLGEGINDAPALKAAHVAIVVQGASDIAQEASDIVILQKSLKVIVEGIALGRGVFANTIKYIIASLSSSFGNFVSIALTSLIIPFLPMLPIQILLVNLLSDLPMVAIATDTIDPDELRKPHDYNLKEIGFLSTILGFVSSVFDFIFFAIFVRLGAASLQTHWFIESMLTELALIYSVRTKFAFYKARMPSSTLLLLSTTVIIISILLPFTHFGQSFFSFIPPNGHNLAVISAIVLTYFITTETVKLLYFKFVFQNGNHSLHKKQ